MMNKYQRAGLKSRTIDWFYRMRYHRVYKYGKMSGADFDGDVIYFAGETYFVSYLDGYIRKIESSHKNPTS